MNVIKTLTRILIMTLLISALMNGVLTSIRTAYVEEGNNGIISQQWQKLKRSVIEFYI